jgi:hypothetical protein
MEKEFIPYEQALALKELGFDEPCLGYYMADEGIATFLLIEKCINVSWLTLAPIYQQAFRWFRENHYLYAIIIPTITIHWTFKTTTVVEGMVEVPPYNHVQAIDYSTYQEAELECLKKLIEIVKNK